MNEFYKTIQSSPGKIEELPILHTCTAYSFRNILRSKELKPYPCDTFKGKDLLYAYYGLPSYRINQKDATGLSSYFPVCIVFEFKHLPDLSKLYPFDTGAFLNLEKLREKYFHHQMQLNDFELKSDIKDAQKLVETYYHTNQNYIEKKPSIKLSDLSTTNFEAQSYLAMISNLSKDQFDDRVSSIELIFDKIIKLSSRSVKHIILPKVFKDDSEIMRLIENDLKITNCDFYSTVRGNPNEYFGLIYNKYQEYLLKNKV